ncbi:Fanconi anemia group B protein [Mauremys reevesii]|uniref:Fanconi anemia group B protein n=1 Tax=Mauremys reevesii TaxID=260615 RepID=UPI00193FC65A|nr:Fanconi anemia group B protein [Mauremys reevesii]XP_039376347.1 Fanconi anemia group B protein [Mauremys reevesii]XP_039376348.1 Fanconi anemia group B protein [Mauremys reevesii]XP_039376349.1 Fanconi anemia group B protein [Mauremys reevesii]
MLSDEQENILSYNGEILIFQLSKAKCAAEKTTRLHVNRMAYDSGTKLFVQKSSGLFSKHGGSLNIEIVCCRCAADFRTGINLPCILMREKKNNSVFKYFLLLLHSSNKFEQCLNFKLDYELKDDIRLLNGPTVLWRHAKKLFYVSTKTCTVLSASVQFSSIEWADEIENEGIIVLGTRTACLPEEKDGQTLSLSDGAIWGSEFVVYAIENQKILTGTCFLPHAYSSVISCVHVCRTAISRSQFRTSVVAVTHKKQLIWFQDSLPKGTCQLPYEEPCSIQVATTSRNDVLYVVSFASGNVCAVQRDSFQVASRWQEVKSVLVDDFIGTGTEQILLLFKNKSNTDSLSTFIITDLGEVSYESNINCKEDFPPTEELQENGFLTIQALEARLQAGCTSVRELQQHLRLKEKVLLESCSALIDLVQEREHILPTAEEEGLVSLWDDAENLHPLGKKKTLTSEVPEYLVEKLWQRVVDDSLVIGVKITESPNLSLNDVSLSLVMEHDFTSVSPVIECQSKIVKLNKTFSALSISSCQMEPQPKRIKLDFHSKNDLKKEFPGRPSKILSDGAKTFVAVTRLSPLLAFRDICCMILLHANKRKYQDHNLQESRQLTLLCGKISLCLEDISSGKYSVNLLRNNSHYTGTMEDIFSILAVSLKFSFQIVSSDCTLTPVNMWLLSQMECMPIKEWPENMFCHKLGSLRGTVFNWNLKTPFEGTLTLFCRNQTILFQCLHSLLGVLPPTCKVKLLRLESKDILTDQFALALEKEMDSLRSSFSSAVSEVENNLTLSCEAGKKMSRVTGSSLSDKKEAVQQFREELRNEQKQSALGMNRTVSGALYRQITLKIAEAQLCSDTIAWRLNIS